MRQQFLIVAFAYAVFLLGGWLFERARVKRSGPDAISIFVVLFLLQCALPGVVIYGLLPFANEASPTTNPVLDRILLSVDLVPAFTVLLLTAWFLVFFYAGCAIGRLALPDTHSQRPHFTLTIGTTRILAIVLAGFALTLYSFSLLGDSWLGRYTNLILYRAGFEGIERNALNANAFALTQTWSWLSVVALIAMREQHGRRGLWLICLVVAVSLALLGVSRRALFLPLLLAYLAVVVYHRRWYWQRVAMAAAPLLLIVAFGKDALASLAWTGSVDSVASTYETIASAVLRAVSEVGLTIVESIGTLMFIDTAPRFGVDHVLALAQRFPEGMLGLAFEFPERIVRVSTEAFAGGNEQDIPPGLAGQMWLDFRFMGPVIWGLFFGLQLAVVQYFFERTRRTLQASAVFGIAVFILALPITTGSFDFTFSIDIIVLAVALWWAVRLDAGPRTAPQAVPAMA